MTAVKSIVSIFYRFMFKIKAEGIENIPSDGGVIIAPNHTSNWDPALIGILCPRDVSFMAKAELFKGKLLSALFRSLGAFPVSRGTGDIEAIKTSIRVLKGGGALVLFPHGTRIKQGEDAPIKNGAVMIAVKSCVNIVPVYITADYKFRSTVKVKFGEPMELSEYFGTKVGQDKQTELSEELRRRMKMLGSNH